MDPKTIKAWQKIASLAPGKVTSDMALKGEGCQQIN